MSKVHFTCAVAGCTASNVSMHTLPRDTALRREWVNFIFSNEVPENVSQHLRLCTAHFSPDCIGNQARYNAGFASKLLLTPGAVPTVLKPASHIQQVCEAKPDSDAEEEEEEAEGERVPHAVAEMCLLTALRWQRQQREALPQHRRVLRELHSLASRKREMTISGPADSSAAYAGGNPSKRTRPERAVQRWVRVTEEGEQLGGGGLYTHGTAPELSRVEDLVKVEVEVEVADGAKLALGTRRRPGRAGAAPVSGGRAGAERDGESADFTCADGRSSDKLKCEPAEISISDRAGADECGWG
ncbi:uncharacterized protein LOC118225706 isoform X3 [Anguilla anguilla]|uniref:uncharacterized protein LOC118225706 isoform X3 n=1 Tax=Anguilla anguilla TaxID=7936 RepID=UPI0015ABC903|nr:uncharacterized protein LOC118225706 isoform X3 [Anguilla anguilla]